MTNLDRILPFDTKTGSQLAHEFGGAVERAKKGAVAVLAVKGWLRLRWSWQGKRYHLSLALPDSKVNRLVAERKARLIEQDIATEHFDPTLAKYNPQNNTNGLSVVALFERYTEYKAKSLDAVSVAKYIGLQGYLKQFFRLQVATSLSEEKALQFREHIRKKLAPVTVRERIAMLKACWQWAIRHKLLTDNVWAEVKVKVPPKQAPRPFTKAEVDKILAVCRAEPDYSHYADFIEFLLSVGCRIGEAAGLRWCHLSEDCSVLWIGESWSRGRRKPTKTNRARTFGLNKRVQGLLLGRRAADCKPDDLVFLSRRGTPIDDHNFRNRAWKLVLERAGVEYRHPRTTRHTFVSHAIDQGLSPSQVCQITGHTEATMFKNYLGSIKGRPELPDLFE